MLKKCKYLLFIIPFFLYGCLGTTTSNNFNNNNNYKITETKSVNIKDHYCKKNDGSIYKTIKQKCNYGDQETILAEYNMFIRNKSSSKIFLSNNNLVPENGLNCVNQKFSNGNYIGQIYLNESHGYGLTSWNNSTHRYIGLSKDGLRDGLGIYFFSPNEYYYGFFKNGKRHGEGVYLINNETYEGLWNKNEFDKQQLIDKRNLLIKVLDSAFKAKAYC